ncbi:MAG: hypothetical protein J6Y91_00935, partial [Alphaproteobacteria bacterium]|nr:hypothetical protein [Alphaproteobacteria bacterium]
MDVNTKELYKQTFGHFCTDAACAAVVIAGTADLFDIVKFFAGYNFLAFCLQPLAGWLLDKFKNIRFEHYIVTAFLLLLIAFAPNLNIWLRVALVGVGNCLFHVGAGALILTTAAKKMMPLGVFVSGGAVGLALGTTFAVVEVWRIFRCLCLAMMVVINIRLPERTSLKTSQVFPWKIIGLLCVCVALRSFMGLAPLTQFEKTLPVLLTITFGVFAGKFLGGILCDKFGIKKVVLMSTAIVLPLFLPALKNPYL